MLGVISHYNHITSHITTAEQEYCITQADSEAAECPHRAPAARVHLLMEEKSVFSEERHISSLHTYSIFFLS